MKAMSIVTIGNCSNPFPYINSFYSKTKISLGTIIVLIRQMRKLQHRLSRSRTCRIEKIQKNTEVITVIDVWKHPKYSAVDEWIKHGICMGQNITHEK